MAEHDFNADLAFVHLSDIHFRKGRAGDIHDQDTDLRNELERDLRRVNINLVPKISGIIISGDIAYAGKKEEFEFASGWIEKIRELVNCPSDCVMVTPGNHDVDRDILLSRTDITDIHQRIRIEGALNVRDAAIAAYLRDPVTGAKLFESISAYNNFAAKYGCSVSPEKPFWERDFKMGNKGTLRIRGLTTTIISGPDDNESSHRLVYGGAQRQLIREDDLRRLVVGHHPPSWTFDGDAADREITQRACIQLYGHQHEQWLTRMDKGVRIIAGAVHPDRNGPGWRPRYSLVAVRLDENGLTARLYPRVWSTEETMFQGDYNHKGCDHRDFTFE